MRAATSVTISYAVTNSHLTLKEPVFLSVTFDNPLDEGITVDASPEHFRVKITRPDGTAQAPEPESPGISPVRMRQSIQQRGSFTEVLLLNKWFVFDIPGRYLLDIKPLGDARTVGDVRLDSFPDRQIPFIIEPLDANRLQAACDDLERRIQGTSSYSEALVFAEALSVIGDPLTVPYLARLLDSRKMFEIQAIQGLERVQNAASIGVLTSHLDSPSEDVRDLVRAALTRINKSSKASQ